MRLRATRSQRLLVADPGGAACKGLTHRPALSGGGCGARASVAFRGAARGDGALCGENPEARASQCDADSSYATFLVYQSGCENQHETPFAPLVSSATRVTARCRVLGFSRSGRGLCCDLLRGQRHARFVPDAWAVRHSSPGDWREQMLRPANTRKALAGRPGL